MKEFFERSGIRIDPLKEEPETSVETELKRAWSKESIVSLKELAIAVWKALNISETSPIYSRMIGEAFPDLSEQGRNEMSVRMRVCIQELATQDDPQMVQRITPEQFKHFANLYLIEKLG